MQLFYSGAIQAAKAQPDPSQSLGGYISVSPVANGNLDNVFQDITQKMVRENQPDVRLLVLTNTTGSPVNNINIYTNRSTYATYQLAAVAPATDSCGKPVFEKLFNGNSLPFQATLEPAEGSGEAIVIESLANNASIGIWIARFLDLTSLTILDGNTTLPFSQWNRNPYPFPNDTSIGCSGLSALLGITFDDNGNASLPAPPTGQPVYDTAQLVISWS